MKAKTRKRLVISSIAMLLVAVLALGTATFAWFTQNTSATANGINAKAVKAANLLVSNAKDLDDEWVWGTSIDYSLGTTATVEGQQVTTPARFYPVSSADGEHWYKAIAGASNSYAKGEEDRPTAADAPTMNGANNEELNSAFLSMLNVKNETDIGGSAIKDVTISWTDWGSLPNYARIAIVPATVSGAEAGANDNVDGVGNKDLGFANNIYALDNTPYDALNSTSMDLTAEGATVEITPDSARSINIGDLEAGEAKYFRLYVWFEGQDAQCTDTLAGQTISNLAFTVTGTPE